MTTFDVDGDLAPDDLRAMVRAVRPDWSVRDARASDRGTDSVYFVDVHTGSEEREVVLKASSGEDPAAFRPEPYLLRAVDERTSIPVPSVLGAVDRHEDVPSPFFLVEYVDGDAVDEFADLPPTIRGRLAEDAGRYLGELHVLGSFERFGPIRLREDAARADDHGSTARGVDVGISGPDYELAVGADGYDDWPSWFRALSEYFLENVEDRFADLVPPIRDHLDARADLVPRDATPVPTHNDYRLWNLLIDRETGETRAVLDFGNEFTAHAEYNLVGAEGRLGGWATPGSAVRERVRDRLFAGYAGTKDLDRSPEARERRDLYRLATHLPALVWFSAWRAHLPDADVEAAASRYREYVRSIVE